MMKQFIKAMVCILMVSTSLTNAKVLPYISIRSQSENAARELVLWQTQINLSCMEDFYGSFSITPEYTRTFRAGKIARLLFHDALNDSCCTPDCATFKVQGSAVENRDSKAWLADNFALPLDYSSTVQISPKIENFLADFNLYLGLDNWTQGLYFRIHAPVVHTRWSLGFCEKAANPGVMNAPLGYYNGAINGNGSTIPFYGVERSDLVGTFEGFVSRCEVPTIEGITFQPLKNARFSRCKRKTTELSDVQMALGWNFWQSECYHFGLNIRAAAPTGSRPYGRYLFEPIVGNGKHWEAGAGLTGHWTLWRSCDEDQEFNVYIDANLTHLFKTHQCRTFDLCGKPLSRYMLASKMTSDVVDLESVRLEQPPTYQFDNEFSSVANLSTIKVDVSAAIQADIALKFAYAYCNWQFDLGYEFWSRSCEKICPRECDSCKKCCCQKQATSEIWALKGDAFVYGFEAEDGGFRQAPEEPVALSSSQRDAQIFCGTNNYFRTGDNAWVSNAGVDNPELAANGDGDQLHNWIGGLLAGEVNIYSSFNPYVFDTAQTKQWDFDNAQSRGMSHKLFGDIGYVWKQDACDKDDCCINWTPYFGVGGEVEFGKVDKRCCTDVTTTCVTKSPAVVQAINQLRNGCCGGCGSSSNCNCDTKCCDTAKCCCTDAAISQWGVWIKGGVSFN